MTVYTDLGLPVLARITTVLFDTCPDCGLHGWIVAGIEGGGVMYLPEVWSQEEAEAQVTALLGGGHINAEQAKDLSQQITGTNLALTQKVGQLAMVAMIGQSLAVLLPFNAHSFLWGFGGEPMSMRLVVTPNRR